MSKATHGLSPAVALSKIDPADRTHATFRAAHGMARRMIRAGTRDGIGNGYATFLLAAGRRWGDDAAPVFRAAARCALDRLLVSHAATGTPAELDRQGALARCVRLEKAPAGRGWCWAWTHDALGSPATRLGLRVQRAGILRQDRARRREVAIGLAADRRAMEGSRFGLTLAGLFALQNATAGAQA